MLNKRLWQISKSVLLYSLLVGGVSAKVVSSDFFLIKILDRSVSFQDLNFQLRNLKALECIDEDAVLIKYFEKSFIKDLNVFVNQLPKTEVERRRYLHKNEKLLEKTRYLFKMLRYSSDQKAEVSPALNKILRESTKENNCNRDILYKDTLKTNFIELMELEIYLRSRYGEQIKKSRNFGVVRPSIDLFVESLDKQFGHEYYW